MSIMRSTHKSQVLRTVQNECLNFLSDRICRPWPGTTFLFFTDATIPGAQIPTSQSFSWSASLKSVFIAIKSSCPVRQQSEPAVESKDSAHQLKDSSVP